VIIAFSNELGQRMDNSFVALMFIGKNQRLVYRAYENATDKFIPLYEEPYETAREIVMRENNKLSGEENLTKPKMQPQGFYNG
jgi:hypothetical protein